MTFKNYIKNNPIRWTKSNFDNTDVLAFMEEAWNAAKEDSKLEVGIVWSSIVEDWSVRDFKDGVVIEDGFDSEEKAKNWALQNGYRVVE